MKYARANVKPVKDIYGDMLLHEEAIATRDAARPFKPPIEVKTGSANLCSDGRDLIKLNRQRESLILGKAAK